MNKELIFEISADMIIIDQPIVYGYGLIIAAAIMAITAVYAGYQQNQAQQRQAGIAKAQAENEALMAQQQQKEAEARAKQVEYDREAQRAAQVDEHRRRMARVEASYAKSGVMLEGTPAEFLSEQAAVDELNVQQEDQRARQHALGIRYKGDMSYYDGMFTSSMYDAKAKTHRAAGKDAMTMGYVKAGGSLISGAMGGMGGSSSPSSSGGGYMDANAAPGASGTTIPYHQKSWMN